MGPLFPLRGDENAMDAARSGNSRAYVAATASTLGFIFPADASVSDLLALCRLTAGAWARKPLEFSWGD